MVAGGFKELAGLGDYGAGLVVDVAVAPQVSGVVEDDFLRSLGG